MIVIGVGINLRPPSAYPARMLRRARRRSNPSWGAPVDRAALVAESLVALDHAMVALRRGRAADLRDRCWRQFGRSGFGRRGRAMA